MKVLNQFKEYIEDGLFVKYARDCSRATMDPVLDPQDTILFEGVWWKRFTPYHMLNYAIVRSALGLDQCREICYLADCNMPAVPWYKRLGLQNFEEVCAYSLNQEEINSRSDELVSKCKTADDILNLVLPEEFPVSALYDGILKRQRAAAVDIRPEKLKPWLIMALQYIERARLLINKTQPKLMVVSHVVGLRNAPFVWLALNQKITVLWIHTEYETLRCVKMTEPEHMFDWVDCPNGEDIERISCREKESLKSKGKKYIEERSSGKCIDLGASYAYRSTNQTLSRDQFCERMGWDSKKKIVAVYASNWFDHPRSCGMQNFRDFLDWIQVTLECAYKNTDVYWIFKPHPCDDWYGGITLKDLISIDGRYSHVAMAKRDLPSNAVIRHADAFITCHGTVAFEASALGKPVLMADRGWCNELGFGVWARSRSDYINKLMRSWYDEVDLLRSSENAWICSGITFCKWDNEAEIFPKWNFKSNQFDSTFTFFKFKQRHVQGEIKLLREWYFQEKRRYHSWKMMGNFK